MWKLKLSEGKDDPWFRSVNNHIGRMYWEFDPNLGTTEEREQVEKFRAKFHKNRFEIKHSSDLLMRMQFEKEKAQKMGLQQVKVGSEEEISEEVVVRTLRRGLRFYSTIQADDGHWPADYAGPLFLLPLLVIGLSVIGKINAIFHEEHKKEILRYIYNHQNVDGGWGLHIEGHSTMFGTALNYVCLRILGEEKDGGNGAMKEARKWILDHGGATFIPSWGKIWLSAHNGSQLWDVDLAVQAILATNLCDEYGSMLKKAHFFINVSQIKDDSGINLSSCYRDRSIGGWTFSTLDHGWPISDCTAEALNAALMLSRMPDDVVGEAIEPSRLYDAVDLILSLQTKSGGFSTYELPRSYQWLEMFNPSETFGKIIVEYPGLVAGGTHMRLAIALGKLVISYFLSNSLLVAEEKAIFHARTR
nr:cycloartenol synthase 2-like [Ipomoea batatas]